MTAAEFKATINNAIAEETDADTIAKMEIVREFFTNASFRRFVSDQSWEATK